MIKVGKVRINENLNSKVFLIFILVSFLIFLFFSINLFSLYIKTKDYVKIDSIVTDVGYNRILHSENDSHSRYIRYRHYANLEYKYKGEKFEK